MTLTVLRPGVKSANKLCVFAGWPTFRASTKCPFHVDLHAIIGSIEVDDELISALHWNRHEFLLPRKISRRFHSIA